MSSELKSKTAACAKRLQQNGHNLARCSALVASKQSGAAAGTWKVHASAQALNTSNPIREIIETMNLAENPEKKVIPLSIGDPTIFGNLKPCEEILDALQEANQCEKYYGYQTAAGMESARQAVAEYHYKCTGNKVGFQDVILASGCSHAIDMCICVLAQPGQNILIPRPGFPLYKTLTSVYGVTYKQYNLLADNNWSIDLKHLESLIDENTAAIVINNPSNPCGSVFSSSHLVQILKLAEKHKKPIIADEIYDKFVFSRQLYKSTQLVSSDGAQQADDLENRRLPSSLARKQAETNSDNLRPSYKNYNFATCWQQAYLEKEQLENDLDSDEDEQRHVPFVSISSLSERVPILTCGGISKTCLIPGLRLGWIIINDRQNVFDGSVRNALNRLTQRLMGPNSLVQGALRDILANVPESFYSETMDFIFENAKLCYERLKAVKGLRPFMPQGSMYLMARFETSLFPDIDGDLDFTSKLMNEESVLVLPGKCFDFPNYFRICLTVPTNVMEEALNRIEEFCNRHYSNKSSRVVGETNVRSSIPLQNKLQFSANGLEAAKHNSQLLEFKTKTSPNNIVASSQPTLSKCN